MLDDSGGLPTLTNLARRLSMNARTLQRRLGNEDLNFQGLLDDCCRRHAIHSVAASRLPISSISARLGYSHPAHFARAFRRWTGTSPSAYRASAATRDAASALMP